MSQPDFNLAESRIAIIGLGLMGGSLAMSLKGKCARIIGFDAAPATLELALSKGIIDQAESLNPSPKNNGRGIWDEIVLLILATPVPTIISILQQLPSLISHPCIIMDIGSTKSDILQAMSTLPENFDPIGGHPICGKEKLGIENADANLYQNTPFVVTALDRSSPKAISAIKQIISAIGANLIEMSAEEHDRVLATTSHLPFLLASALVHSTATEFAPLIGPGFRSTSRLAGTPSHMMLGVLKSNRENVLEAIQYFNDSLSKFRSALENEDYDRLEGILEQAIDINGKLKNINFLE